MKIRALKTTTDLPKGCVGDVEDSVGKELIALGYAIEVLPLDKQEAANDNDPFDVAPLRGGLTGEDVPQSSLPVDQVQPEPTSELAAAPADTSPSTTDTSSAHGQTSSTHATTTGGKRKRGRPRSRG